MTDRPHDGHDQDEGRTPDALSPLVRQWPPEEPPAWLDANIRAAAHDSARLAGQKAARTPGKAIDSGPRARRPWSAWLPVGGTVATALLAVLLVTARPDADRPAATSASTAVPAAPATTTGTDKAAQPAPPVGQPVQPPQPGQSSLPAQPPQPALSSQPAQPSPSTDTTTRAAEGVRRRAPAQDDTQPARPAPPRSQSFDTRQAARSDRDTGRERYEAERAAPPAPMQNDALPRAFPDAGPGSQTNGAAAAAPMSPPALPAPGITPPTGMMSAPAARPTPAPTAKETPVPAVPAAPPAAQGMAEAKRTQPLPASRSALAGAADAPAAASSAEATVPASGEDCVRLLESLSRERRSDDARRMLTRCRERFPDQQIPAAIEREYGGR